MSAISEGIKTVGVGKKGSKPLGADLIKEIYAQIQENEVSDLEKGAFYAGLLMKGATTDEQCLLDIAPIPDVLIADAPEHIQDICQILVAKQTLSEEQAYQLGVFLFSDLRGDGARGLVASLLRVRYETQDEYAGLLHAIEDTFTEEFKKQVPHVKPIIQLAEPFDGVTRSYLNTPLLARYFESQEYRVVSLVGRNSGPKFGNNLDNLAKELHATYLKKSLELSDAKQEFGSYLHQEDLTPAIDKWVEYRHKLIKRPFLATLERFCNPLRCDVLIASAFHAPYGDKMISICERSNIPASIIVCNGLEGTINFPLLRATKILASVKLSNEKYERKVFMFDSSQKFYKEEKLCQPSLGENTRLIKEFTKRGKTNNRHFDVRIQYMCTSFKHVLDWIEGMKL